MRGYEFLDLINCIETDLAEDFREDMLSLLWEEKAKAVEAIAYAAEPLEKFGSRVLEYIEPLIFFWQKIREHNVSRESFCH